MNQPAPQHTAGATTCAACTNPRCEHLGVCQCPPAPRYPFAPGVIEGPRPTAAFDDKKKWGQSPNSLHRIAVHPRCRPLAGRNWRLTPFFLSLRETLWLALLLLALGVGAALVLEWLA